MSMKLLTAALSCDTGALFLSNLAMLSLAFFTASVAGSASAGAATISRRRSGSRRFIAEVLPYDGPSGMNCTLAL